MAIIFVSPKKRQRIFFWALTICLILFLFIVSLIIFPPEFKNSFLNAPQPQALYKPDVKINFGIVDSPIINSLSLFEKMETEFDYMAEDSIQNKVNGKILAFNKEDAQSILEKQGLKVLTLQESNVGRSEPFIPYYQASSLPANPKK